MVATGADPTGRRTVRPGRSRRRLRRSRRPANPERGAVRSELPEPASDRLAVLLILALVLLSPLLYDASSWLGG
jgi:hypothetical protein